MALTRRAVLVAALAAACAPARPRTPAAAPSPSPTAVGPTPTPPTSTGTPATGTSAPATAGPATEISSGPRASPYVALTFHGAGDPHLATALLGEAERAGAKVTVLAVGSWLEANPAMARRILDGGHELGNHTLTHPPLRRLDAVACYREIAGCASVLQRLTGTPGRWFRPSGTPHATALIAAAAGRAGYRTTLAYDVDPRDYAGPGAAAVRDRTSPPSAQGRSSACTSAIPGRSPPCLEFSTAFARRACDRSRLVPSSLRSLTRWSRPACSWSRTTSRSGPTCVRL